MSTDIQRLTERAAQLGTALTNKNTEVSHITHVVDAVLFARYKRSSLDEPGEEAIQTVRQTFATSPHLQGLPDRPYRRLKDALAKAGARIDIVIAARDNTAAADALTVTKLKNWIGQLQAGVEARDAQIATLTADIEKLMKEAKLANTQRRR